MELVDRIADGEEYPEAHYSVIRRYKLSSKEAEMVRDLYDAS